MKKRIIVLGVAAFMSAMLLTGCCDHEWEDATCTEPKTCTLCGKTEGEALGHKWKDATCTEQKTCTVCGETEGKALGHKWEDATCTEPKTCSRCKETQGDPAGHKVEEWKVTKEATCSSEGEETGKCTVCGESVTQKIDKKDHTPGDWVVTEEAQWNLPGKRTKACTVCGEVVESEEYELSDEEKETIFKASCQSYSYDQIARDPDSYNLEHAVYTGKVVQVMNGDDGGMTYRINITPTSWGGYEDTIYVKLYDYAADRMTSNVLEDDIVTVWGYNFSTITYKSVMGAKITIPAVVGEYIEIVG